MPVEEISFHCPKCGEQRLAHRQAVNHPLHVLGVLGTGVVGFFLPCLWIITVLWLLVWIAESASTNPYRCTTCGTKTK